MVGKIRLTPEIRKKVIDRRARINKAIVDLRARRSSIMADLKEMRAREGKFKTTAKKLADLLKQYNTNLKASREALTKLQLTIESIQGDISKRKLRKQPVSLAQQAILSKSKKEVPGLKKDIKSFERAIASTDFHVRMNNDNLRAVQREITAMSAANEKVSAKLEDLNGR